MFSIHKLKCLAPVLWMTVQDEFVGRTSVSLVDLLTNMARREVDFTYQVALPHMRDDHFRYSAVERYRKLLLLRRLRAREFTSVTSLPADILLMMRVHALHPTQFNVDMRRLFDDWAAQVLEIDWASLEYEAPPPSVVSQSELIWQRQFGRGETLFVDGSGVRGRRGGSVQCGGEETAMRHLPRDHLVTSRAGVESCDVTFTSVTVDDVWSPRRSGVKRVSVEARLLGQNSFARGETLFRVCGSVGAPLSSGKKGTGLGSAHFNASHNLGIELSVSGRQSVMCFARQRTITTKTFNPIQHCSTYSKSPATAITTVVLPKIIYTDPKITVTFNVQVSWL